MRRFLEWYNSNFEAITWFIIGFLAMGGITRLERGQYDQAMVDFILIGVNFWLLKTR